MDRKELARQIRSGTDWDYNQVERVIQKGCDIACLVISGGKEVQIRGFGTLKPVMKNSRISVEFYPGQDLKDACKLLEARLEEKRTENDKEIL